MVLNTGRLETNIVSLERIKEYSEVEQEVCLAALSLEFALCGNTPCTVKAG